MLGVGRVQIELWAYDMEERQRLTRSTVSHRLSTVAGFYRFAHIDGFIDADPTKHVRRPKAQAESRTLGLDRTELGAFIYSAEALGVREHALACLLGLLGLRISETLSIRADDFSEVRGHRVVRIIGKGRKVAIVPLPPRVPRAVDQFRAHTPPVGFFDHRPGRRWTEAVQRELCDGSVDVQGSPNASHLTR